LTVVSIAVASRTTALRLRPSASDRLTCQQPSVDPRGSSRISAQSRSATRHQRRRRPRLNTPRGHVRACSFFRKVLHGEREDPRRPDVWLDVSTPSGDRRGASDGPNRRTGNVPCRSVRARRVTPAAFGAHNKPDPRSVNQNRIPERAFVRRCERRRRHRR
jgi:hypothetical protein